MFRILVVAAVALSLAACATTQVQSTCERVEHILSVARPFLAAAPPSVQLAVTVLGAGAVACGTPEYAAARETVVKWLAERGVGALPG